MKLPPSKSEMRDELQQQMREYLARGGEVQEVPRGASSRDNADGPIRANSFVPNSSQPVPPEDKLPLNDVIQSIEARRRAKTSRAKSTKEYKPKPKRKMIYDDFGEPLRWEWVEE